MWYVIALALLTGADESYAPVKIGRGLWRSPAGFVYRSDKLFTGDELRRQEAAAGFDVGPVPPRTEEEIKMAFGVRQERRANPPNADPLQGSRFQVRTASTWQADENTAASGLAPLCAQEPTRRSPSSPSGLPDSITVPSSPAAAAPKDVSPQLDSSLAELKLDFWIEVMQGRRSPGIAAIALAVVLYVFALDHLSAYLHKPESGV